MRYLLFLIVLPLFFSCEKDPAIPESNYFPLKAGKINRYQMQFLSAYDGEIWTDTIFTSEITADTVIAGYVYNGIALKEPSYNWGIMSYIRKEGSRYIKRLPASETEYVILDEAKPVGYKWDGLYSRFEIKGKYKSRTYEGKTFNDVIEVIEYKQSYSGIYNNTEGFALTAYSNNKGIVYEYRPYGLSITYADTKAVLLE